MATTIIYMFKENGSKYKVITEVCSINQQRLLNSTKTEPMANCIIFLIHLLPWPSSSLEDGLWLSSPVHQFQFPHCILPHSSLPILPAIGSQNNTATINITTSTYTWRKWVLDLTPFSLVLDLPETQLNIILLCGVLKCSSCRNSVSSLH